MHSSMLLGLAKITSWAIVGSFCSDRLHDDISTFCDRLHDDKYI
jgi:hypothetical protein